MDRLFNTRTGNIILSVIWGLGIALLFYKVCDGTNCLVVNKNTKAEEAQNILEFGRCTPTYPSYQGDIVPPKCNNTYQSSPTLDYYEQRKRMNCGAKGDCGKPGCYSFNPMDSIFRSPSQQITYPYH